MAKASLNSVVLLVLVVAACGGDESGVTSTGSAPLVALPPSSSSVAPAPTPTPAPPPVTTAALVLTQQSSSLMPFIDIAKIPEPEAGFSEARVKVDLPHNPKPTQNTNGTGQFRFTCTFSHMGFNDPIVFPNKQGAAHLHTFFGNTAIDHTSTQASIENTGNSTCAGGTANRTGYWIPSFIDTKDGTPLKPSRIMVYYKSNSYSETRVQAYPAGLRIIAGDMTSSVPQEHMFWNCIGADGSEGQRTKGIPSSCVAGSTVEIAITFPDCWDGVNLDSPDHKSHMSYTIQLQTAPWTRNCPRSHPIQVPQLTEKLYYTVFETGSTARWRLSSDNYSRDLPGGLSIHADWFNGWDPKVQATWIRNCLQADRDCHGYLLGDGTTLF